MSSSSWCYCCLAIIASYSFRRRFRVNSDILLLSSFIRFSSYLTVSYNDFVSETWWFKEVIFSFRLRISIRRSLNVWLSYSMSNYMDFNFCIKSLTCYSKNLFSNSNLLAIFLSFSISAFRILIIFYIRSISEDMRAVLFSKTTHFLSILSYSNSSWA